MKILGKVLCGLASAAALAALVPYSRKENEEDGSRSLKALLWQLNSRPSEDGGRAYDVNFGLSRDCTCEECSCQEVGEAQEAPAVHIPVEDAQAAAEAAAQAADEAQAAADAAQETADEAQALADEKAQEAEAALDAAEEAQEGETQQ